MRNILISGANRGIGLKIAYKELQEGNRLSLGVRDMESIKGSIIDPKNWKKGQVIVNKYDALNINTAKDWIKNTIAQFGSFDTLINCSGSLSKKINQAVKVCFFEFSSLMTFNISIKFTFIYFS